MLFVSIKFSLEKDSVVFSAFVNYNIMLCIEFSSLSDEYWTSTTIYRPSRRNQSEQYLPEVHGNLTQLSFLSSRTQ